MIIHETQIRIEYVQVDTMGFVYHSHYVEFFDTARTELIRSLGITNRELEEEGFMLPVMEVKVKYFMPAHYDDVITVRTTLKNMPSARIAFYYEVTRGEDLLTTGEVHLGFMNSVTKKASRPPKRLLDIVKPYFNR